MTAPGARLPIVDEPDVVVARQRGRELAEAVGFSATDQALVATAISEIARNVVRYAGSGTIELRALHEPGRDGLEVVCADEGPGIEDVELAMQDGFSTGGGLGIGLPGARRLMDEFDLWSAVGCGTRVTMRKWRG